MTVINVRIKDELKAFLDEEATSEGFASTAEFVEALLTSFWRNAFESVVELELIRRIDGPQATEIPVDLWEKLKSRLRKN
ncbi:MAG TPA: hypothetical protein VIM11_27450 [Tepidisphaeraceae bacterium]|jgi:Arc/MetJ-type ribon-helix-helix transcriptional regulator